MTLLVRIPVIQDWERVNGTINAKITPNLKN